MADKKKKPKELEANTKVSVKKTELEEREDVEMIRGVFTDDIFSDDELLKEWGDLADKSKKLTPAQKEREKKLVDGFVTRYGLENGRWVKNLSYNKYREALGKMRHDVAKEYSCKTALEFMLADRIVASYWRSMQYDTVFNRMFIKEDGGFSFDQLKVNILKELNKGMEFATRQLNANILLLKDLKQPRLNVKVTTDNAYIAQNQQVINTDEVNPIPKENH